MKKDGIQKVQGSQAQAGSLVRRPGAKEKGRPGSARLSAEVGQGWELSRGSTQKKETAGHCETRDHGARSTQELKKRWI